MGGVSDRNIALVLHWTLIERGTAGLADAIGPAVVVPNPPSKFMPPEAAVCGPVVLLRRQASAAGELSASSYAVMGEVVRPGAVVMIRAANVGAGFGSGIALRAAHGGAVALVTDGAWRDTGRLEQLALPVGANGTVPARPAGYPVVPTESEDLFGVTWRNGDWFLRDADGALRLPNEMARTFAESLLADPDPELRNVLAEG